MNKFSIVSSSSSCCTVAAAEKDSNPFKIDSEIGPWEVQPKEAYFGPHNILTIDFSTVNKTKRVKDKKTENINKNAKRIRDSKIIEEKYENRQGISASKDQGAQQDENSRKTIFTRFMYLHKNQESEINENCSVPYENLPPSTIQQNYEGMYNFTSSQCTKTIDNCGPKPNSRNQHRDICLPTLKMTEIAMQFAIGGK